MRAFGLLAAVLALAMPAFSQGRDNEKYHFEFAPSVWLANIGGSTESDAFLAAGSSVRVKVDLERDLGFGGDRDGHFFGRLVVKPFRRHRLLIEGVPLRFSAETVPPLSIAVGGRPFPPGRAILSQGDASYLFGGYQYDLISGQRGHFGVLGGVASAKGDLETKLKEPQDIFEGRAGFLTGSLTLPLAGGGFRGYITDWLSVAVEFKGISAGNRGRFLQGGARVGANIGCCLILEAGYAWIEGRVTTRSTEVELHFQGPLFGLALLDR